MTRPLSPHGRLVERFFRSAERSIGRWMRLESEVPQRLIHDPVEGLDDETPESFASRIEAAMQEKLREQTKNRLPFVGVRW